MTDSPTNSLSGVSSTEAEFVMDVLRHIYSLKLSYSYFSSNGRGRNAMCVGNLWNVPHVVIALSEDLCYNAYM